MIDAAGKVRVIVDQLEQVPKAEMCDCGAPKSEHVFWDDKIYDVQGHRCPHPGRFDAEYRFNAQLTRERHLDAKVALLQTQLSTHTLTLEGRIRQLEELAYIDVELKGRTWKDAFTVAQYDADEHLKRAEAAEGRIQALHEEIEAIADELRTYAYGSEHTLPGEDALMFEWADRLSRVVGPREEGEAAARGDTKGAT